MRPDRTESDALRLDADPAPANERPGRVGAATPSSRRYAAASPSTGPTPTETPRYCGPQAMPDSPDVFAGVLAPGSEPAANVQLKATGTVAPGDRVQQHASNGVQGASERLPHADAIQRSFGKHDISPIRSIVGGAATAACNAIGADAYMTNGRAGFKHAPDLHTSAHEAAHFIQQAGGVQLKGGVGNAGDNHEAHADAVADRVVAGKSAEDLLDQYSGSSRASTPRVQLRHHPSSQWMKDRMKIHALHGKWVIVSDAPAKVTGYIDQRGQCWAKLRLHTGGTSARPVSDVKKFFRLINDPQVLLNSSHVAYNGELYGIVRWSIKYNQIFLHLQLEGGNRKQVSVVEGLTKPSIYTPGSQVQDGTNVYQVGIGHSKGKSRVTLRNLDTGKQATTSLSALQQAAQTGHIAKQTKSQPTADRVNNVVGSGSTAFYDAATTTLENQGWLARRMSPIFKTWLEHTKPLGSAKAIAKIPAIAKADLTGTPADADHLSAHLMASWAADPRIKPGLTAIMNFGKSFKNPGPLARIFLMQLNSYERSQLRSRCVSSAVVGPLSSKDAPNPAGVSDSVVAQAMVAGARAAEPLTAAVVVGTFNKRPHLQGADLYLAAQAGGTPSAKEAPKIKANLGVIFRNLTAAWDRGLSDPQPTRAQKKTLREDFGKDHRALGTRYAALCKSLDALATNKNKGTSVSPKAISEFVGTAVRLRQGLYDLRIQGITNMLNAVDRTVKYGEWGLATAKFVKATCDVILTVGGGAAGVGLARGAIVLGGYMATSKAAQLITARTIGVSDFADEYPNGLATWRIAASVGLAGFQGVLSAWTAQFGARLDVKLGKLTMEGLKSSAGGLKAAWGEYVKRSIATDLRKQSPALLGKLVGIVDKWLVTAKRQKIKDPKTGRVTFKPPKSFSDFAMGELKKEGVKLLFDKLVPHATKIARGRLAFSDKVTKSLMNSARTKVKEDMLKTAVDGMTKELILQRTATLKLTLTLSEHLKDTGRVGAVFRTLWSQLKEKMHPKELIKAGVKQGLQDIIVKGTTKQDWKKLALGTVSKQLKSAIADTFKVDSFSNVPAAQRVKMIADLKKVSVRLRSQGKKAKELADLVDAQVTSLQTKHDTAKAAAKYPAAAKLAKQLNRSLGHGGLPNNGAVHRSYTPRRPPTRVSRPQPLGPKKPSQRRLDNVRTKSNSHYGRAAQIRGMVNTNVPLHLRKPLFDHLRRSGHRHDNMTLAQVKEDLKQTSVSSQVRDHVARRVVAQGIASKSKSIGSKRDALHKVLVRRLPELGRMDEAARVRALQTYVKGLKAKHARGIAKEIGRRIYGSRN